MSNEHNTNSKEFRQREQEMACHQPCGYAKALMWVVGIFSATGVIFGMLLLSAQSSAQETQRKLTERITEAEKDTIEVKGSMKMIEERTRETREDVREIREDTTDIRKILTELRFTTKYPAN